MPALGSALQEEMALKLAAAGLGPFRREWHFSTEYRWRFDFAWPRQGVALEVDGGAFRGRHAGGKYLRASHERQNIAVLGGWRLLRVTKDMVRDGSAVEIVRRVLEAFPCQS
jgi:very-short-patch-repair endonuclease